MAVPCQPQQPGPLLQRRPMLAVALRLVESQAQALCRQALRAELALVGSLTLVPRARRFPTLKPRFAVCLQPEEEAAGGPPRVASELMAAVLRS